MTFTVRKASDYNYNETITVNSLKKLKAINKKLIIDFTNMIITIYDDYVE